MFNIYKEKAGITAPGTVHTLRHCFATHALEAGTDVLYITDLGCNAVFDPENKLPDGFYANKILELIGPKTIRNSLSHLFHGGIVCNTGILGGEYYLNGFDSVYRTDYFRRSVCQQEVQVRQV